MSSCKLLLPSARRSALASARRTTALPVVIRPFSSACALRTQQAQAPASSQAQPPANVGPSTPSSVPEGTVLKGINILKDGKDPVAMADNQYPDWLWTLLEPKKTEWTDEEKLSIKYLRTQTKEKIKANSLAKRSR
ncbi:39S ribosomal protein L37, mitochondrial [Geranomyces variabilis]|uniref:Large ribosomal subunit protein mL54 n=1 Tax=Geranomyces variabilis TaxID=109894 RepID=A0AAD5TG04_9FUNG|nr:39S ribosomal protein L37, mitochondrial [Geranomyces variabilis]